MKYKLTAIGTAKVEAYLEKCAEKRKSILASGVDTTTEVIKENWKVSDVEYDLQTLANSEKEGEFNETYLLTDDIAFDYPLVLREGVDYIKRKQHYYAPPSVSNTEEC